MKWILDIIRNNPYVLLVLANLFWGSNFALGKVLGEQIPPFHLSLFRWGVGILFFLPFAWGELKEIRAGWHRHWKPLFWMSLTGVVGFNSLAYLSLRFTSSINASLVNSITPIIIVILSYLFLKERFGSVQLAGIFISLVGVVWIVCKGDIRLLTSFQFNVGDLIMIIAVVFWAIYSVLAKKFGAVVKQKATFWIIMVLGFPFYAVLSIIEESYWPLKISEVPLPYWIGVLYIGIFPCVVSFLCWTRGIMTIGASKAANFLHLCVPFTVIVAFFFGEMPSLLQFVGGMIILLGVFMASNMVRLSEKTPVIAVAKKEL
jgi:drug/metabolite transporter (DMT)-like permease